MIIARYITKDLLRLTLLLSALLLVIALSNRFVVYFARTAAGVLPFNFTVKICLLYIPELLTLLLPISFYIATLLTLSRMYTDSELYVLLAAGMSFNKLLSMVYKSAVVIATIVMALSFYIVPEVSNWREKLLQHGEAYGILEALLPESFQNFGNGRFIFYVGAKDKDSNSIKQIFIAENSASEQAIIVAKTAVVEKNAANNYTLILNNGLRYQMLPDGTLQSTVEFASYGRQLNFNTTTAGDNMLRLKSSTELLRSLTQEDKAEFYWRLSLPISVLVLTMYALVLSNLPPRSVRFGRFFEAILLFILYYNAFTIAKRLLARQLVNWQPIVMTVHLGFFLFGLGLYAWQTGIFSKKTT